jgi:hypothetical protein
VLLTLFTEGYTSYIRVICEVKENKTMGHLTYVLLGVDKLIAFLRKNIPLFSCTTITSVCFLCVFVITMSWCRYAFNFDNGLKNLCAGSLCGLGGDPCHCFNRLCCPIPGMDNPTTRPMCCIVMYSTRLHSFLPTNAPNPIRGHCKTLCLHINASCILLQDNS